MKAVIIDDEPLARSIVKEYLKGHSNIEVIGECNNGFEGVKAIGEHKPDLIFLDIQMPKINGFEMLELLDNPPPVIFTTAFDEFAIKAFETHAIDYLLKPFDKDRFDKALQKFFGQKQTYPAPQSIKPLLDTAIEKEQNHRVVVKDGSKIKIIPVHQIQYIEAADDYVKLITAEGFFLKNKTMAFYEKLLTAQNFIRIHRSYLVNSSLITRIDLLEKEGHVVSLKTGRKLPVSKNGYGRLREQLGI